MPVIQHRGITLLGITFSNLFSDDAVQLGLPFEGLHSAAIDTTVDGLRDRFGATAVTRAVLLGRREGIHVPLLPD
jgi:DNA polymerase-4